MGVSVHIAPPNGAEDTEGAMRVLGEFLSLYQPALERVDRYLEKIMSDIGPLYAEAYKPWHDAVHDLFHGVYLMSKRIPLPDLDSFVEAIKTFSFDSAIQFLRDLCINCRLKLENDWAERFHEHIHLLLFSVAVLNNQKQQSLAR